jgi:Uma2 family endonuclease
MAAEPIQKRLFTTAEYHQMLQAGILSEDDRVELIEGEIWEMSPIGSWHAGSVNRLTSALVRAFGNRAVVSVQNPVHLDGYSEPQPDLAILRYREDFYSEVHPTPEDTLILIEVADSSVQFDRQVKTRLYAKKGVPEVWLFVLPESRIEVYRDPSPEGYQQVAIVRPGERLSPLAFPDLAIEVNAILG